jgi:hypothetical protein
MQALIMFSTKLHILIATWRLVKPHSCASFSMAAMRVFEKFNDGSLDVAQGENEPHGLEWNY